MELKPGDVDVRITDQRIGMGIGGMNTIIRLWHKPTGIIIEVPNLGRGQHKQYSMAMSMLEYGLTEVEDNGNQ